MANEMSYGGGKWYKNIQLNNVHFYRSVFDVIKLKASNKNTKKKQKVNRFNKLCRYV